MASAVYWRTPRLRSSTRRATGQPIAENTLQFEWISTLKWGYEARFRNDPQVFVAGDLLW